MVILRARDESDYAFVSLLESHGRYDGASERTVGSHSRVRAMRHDRIDGSDVVRLTLTDGSRVAIAISHDTDESAHHRVSLDGETLEWTGFAAVIELEAGEE